MAAPSPCVQGAQAAATPPGIALQAAGRTRLGASTGRQPKAHSLLDRARGGSGVAATIGQGLFNYNGDPWPGHNQPSCGRPARRAIKRGKAAPRRRASEVASVRGESRHDESRSLARGDFARARRPVSAMLRRGSAVRLSAQTGGVDSRPRPLQLQRRSLAWATMGVAYSDAEVWLLRLPPASGRRLAAGRRMRVKADLPRVR